MMARHCRRTVIWGAMLLLCVCSAPAFAGGAVTRDEALTRAAEIPIQYQGRVKSLDVFAREMLRFVSGQEQWEGKPALEFVMNTLPHPEGFRNIAFIRIDYPPLKEALKLSADEKFFSLAQLDPQFNALIVLVQQAQDKRDRDERPGKLEQKAEMLYGRMMTAQNLSNGNVITVIPSGKLAAWQSAYGSSSPLAAEFRGLMTLYAQGDHQNFSASAEDWTKKILALSDEVSLAHIRLENFYYRAKPFHYAWILYLLAAALLMSFARNPVVTKTAYVILAGAFLAHSAGLTLRVMILGRPPVSNMYESLIFMNWILMVCALIYFFLKRKMFFLTTSAVASALVMIYADLLPIEQSLDVLAPVLRSSYWLMVHVMTIVASYGIFGLAMALGHRHLFLAALGKMSAHEKTVSAHVLTRLLQAGLIALGVGTVLGGVWANESWGRFWGWDPKETWAFITFLGYLAVVHLRSAGKLSDFALAVCSVVGFLLVLMTWYGVNFLLGRGLHSYGSGSGGVIWIVYYLILEVLFLGFSFIGRFKRA